MNAVTTTTRKAPPKVAPKARQTAAQPVEASPLPVAPIAEAEYSIPASRMVISEVGAIHETAQHILSTQVEEMNSSAAWGVLTLVELLSKYLEAAEDETEERLSGHLVGFFPDLSNEYLVVLEVARAVNRDGLDDLTLWATIHLLGECKRLVDNHVDALMAAVHGGNNEHSDDA